MSTATTPTSSAAAHRVNVQHAVPGGRRLPGRPPAQRQTQRPATSRSLAPPGAGNHLRVTPYGTVDRTHTNALTLGGSLQATNDDKVFGHDNYFIVGAQHRSQQRSISAPAASSATSIPTSLSGRTSPSPGTGSIIHTLANIGYAPVELDAKNTYYGLYATDTFDVTTRLSVDRRRALNVAKITMADLLGTSPDLNGNHTFKRLNPVVGLTYKLLPA